MILCHTLKNSWTLFSVLRNKSWNLWTIYGGRASNKVWPHEKPICIFLYYLSGPLSIIFSDSTSNLKILRLLHIILLLNRALNNIPVIIPKHSSEIWFELVDTFFFILCGVTYLLYEKAKIMFQVIWYMVIVS